MSTRWVNVAKHLMNMYVIDGRCRLCGEKIFGEGENMLKRFVATYRHFKEKHGEKIVEVKQSLMEEKPVLVVDRYFKPT